jgi:hypothetical protein
MGNDMRNTNQNAPDLFSAFNGGRWSVLVLGALLLLVLPACGQVETLWIEAEHLEGIQGYCWPMARGKESSKTHGAWGLSGPGWAAEFNQGGESGFLSIACGPGDDKAVASKEIAIPVEGEWHVWMRCRDNREVSDRFQVRIEQPGGPTFSTTWGEKPIVSEDNEAKLFWDGAFGWEGHTAQLQKGLAKLILASAFAEDQCRQVDCIVLTTDRAYRPLIKERPLHPTTALLEEYRKHGFGGLEPLVRRRGSFAVPVSWRPCTFKHDLVYLWNCQGTETTTHKNDGRNSVPETKVAAWLTGDPQGILYPHNMPPGLKTKFIEKYAGKKDVPIFSDPRIAPAFHGVGPVGLGSAVKRAADAPPTVEERAGEALASWLDADPNRLFGGMMNYWPDWPLSSFAKQTFFEKYRDRFVGTIAGESLGYFEANPAAVKQLDTVSDRREYITQLGQLLMNANRAKQRIDFGDDLEKLGNPYALTIPCLSSSGISWYNLSYLWGAQTVGYESSSCQASMLGMRTAFLRGAARQHGRKTATYRSCNFGDAGNIFTAETHWYTKPENLFDNYYSVFSGAGMTWYKFDIWYQYMAGSALFYHEQGFDEFWTPGGTDAAGNWGLQLSPKGKLVDRFLRLTASSENFDRGTPFTPAAILVDFAHGWDPASFTPRHWGQQSSASAPATKLDLHDKSMHGLFWTAYHPIGIEEQKPLTALNETYLHGLFGDIFDVVYAYPDTKLWTTIDTYPVTFVAGDIKLTAAEGARLEQYIEQGGTLVVAEGQFQGPGATELDLPKAGAEGETASYTWALDRKAHSSQRFRYHPIVGGRTLATVGDRVIAAAFDRGEGRLIYLSVPYALGIDQEPVPVLAQLMAHATRDLMPFEVQGDVEWSVNRNRTGWMVTLLNAAGQIKPQHGIFPTDFRENRTVRIVCRVPVKGALDRLLPSDSLEVKDNATPCTVEAGGVRIIEIHDGI